MTGKDYVVEAKERVDRLLAAMKTRPELEADPVMASLAKTSEILDLIKNKATLKTRPGTNLAFPVYDGINKLEEVWTDGGDSADLGELKEQIEEFFTAVERLNAALKERTVIMT
ncbi:MAG TPA: hypothetical protein VK564_04560 [Thermodesulfobacteriota bacterium]|nr:hypothetical protein [Thermodesulfobacteriota bacterium]